MGGSLDVQVSSADVVDGLVVQHDGDIGVLQQRVSGEDGVVGLDYGGGDLGRRVDGESQLRLLSVINGESLEQKRSESGPGSSSDSVEDQESLESGAVVGELSDSVETEVDDLSSNGVVSSGEVVGGVLLSRDELLWVEELSVGSRSDLVDDGGFEINHDTSGHVLSSSSLREEGAEGVVSLAWGLVHWELTIRSDSVF